MNARVQAQDRVNKKIEALQQIIRDKSQEMINRKDAIAQVSTMPGWVMVVEDLQLIIPYLNELIADTSPFRIFKVMELRSQKKAYEKLFKALKTHELGSILSGLRDQAEK